MTLRLIENLPAQIHATAVALENKAALLIGASGSGKSALALQLMAYGAQLVSDDRCDLHARNERIYVSKPTQMPNAIEAREFGILPALCVNNAVLYCVIDMDKYEKHRLPVPSKCNIGPVCLPIFACSDKPHFPAAILQYLKTVT